MLIGSTLATVTDSIVRLFTFAKVVTTQRVSCCTLQNGRVIRFVTVYCGCAASCRATYSKETEEWVGVPECQGAAQYYSTIIIAAVSLVVCGLVVASAFVLRIYLKKDLPGLTRSAKSNLYTEIRYTCLTFCK